jgi:hypothetical protein
VIDTRHFISSAACDIDRLAAARGHWGVESIHWLLDIELKDGLSRYRTGHGAKNTAAVRRFALVAPIKQRGASRQAAKKQAGILASSSKSFSSNDR